MGILQYTFYSENLREQTTVHMILPAFERDRGYGNAETYYHSYTPKKTVYVLHGGSDDSTLYLRRTRIEEYAVERDIAVVFPQVRNSFYCNMHRGKQYFSYLSEELPDTLEQVFRLSADWRDRYVLGNSMGSHGAFKWALNRPDFFAAAAGMSGVGDVEELGFFEREDPRVFEAFGTSEDFKNSQNDCHYLIDKLLASKERLPRFYSCCGLQDPYLEGNQKFILEAEKKGFPIQFEVGPGGHEWSFWDRWLPIMLDHMLLGTGG